MIAQIAKPPVLLLLFFFSCMCIQKWQSPYDQTGKQANSYTIYTIVYYTDENDENDANSKGPLFWL